MVIGLLGLLVLTACGGVRDDLTVTPEPIGQFRLGHNIAVTPDPERGPFSRQATAEEWNAAMRKAVADRFDETRFPGEDYYHIGVAIEGYVLAAPGIPLVYSPKSVLIVTVNFFEDSTRTKLNDEPIQLTVFEPCCSIPFLGSGLSKSREEQLEGLAFNAARAIERTMRKNAEWFGGTPEDLPEDETIVEGNVLVDDPDAILPDQSPPVTN
jgi:GAF domain-containing protein